MERDHLCSVSAHLLSMYVLMCPCITDPSIRASGITSDMDRVYFQKARMRCEHFGIEIVSLPCPETLYLGPDRSPGTYLERLDTPQFEKLLCSLEEEVTAIIAKRGAPLCVIGVNSSPTCGVTSTYYGSRDGSPGKISGRGVFLKRFPNIRMIDVKEFARYRVYLAAPLFSDAEKDFNLKLCNILTSNLFHVYLPQEVGDDTHCRGASEHREIFRKHKEALDTVDLMVAVIEGADADSGTSWEMGYACHRGIPVYAVRTDFRIAGHNELVNLMLEQSSVIIRDPDDLPYVIGSPCV